MGADHPGFVDHHHVERTQRQPPVGQPRQRGVHREPLARSTFGDGDVHGLPSRCDHDHRPPTLAFHQGPQGAHRGGLPRPRRRRQRLHQLGAGRDRGHRGVLLRGEPQRLRGVELADPARVAQAGLVDHVEHPPFLDQDQVHGEPFGAFALMRQPRPGQPHGDCVDALLDDLARHHHIPCGAVRATLRRGHARVVGHQGKLRADHLDQVRAGQRGLVRAGRHRRHLVPIHHHPAAARHPRRRAAGRGFPRPTRLALRGAVHPEPPPVSAPTGHGVRSTTTTPVWPVWWLFGRPPTAPATAPSCGR